jgi:hypothetical protein
MATSATRNADLRGGPPPIRLPPAHSCDLGTPQEVVAITLPSYHLASDDVVVQSSGSGPDHRPAVSPQGKSTSRWCLAHRRQRGPSRRDSRNKGGLTPVRTAQQALLSQADGVRHRPHGAWRLRPPGRIQPDVTDVRTATTHRAPSVIDSPWSRSPALFVSHKLPLSVTMPYGDSMAVRGLTGYLEDERRGRNSSPYGR